MSKRQIEQESDSDIDVSSTDEELEQQEEDQEDIVNVDFDFFDLNPEVDFHATKNLLRQLLGEDSKDFDLSAIADLILSDNHVGTTIKTEGQESDPFSLLSVVNLTQNLAKPGLNKLVDYLFKKTAKKTEFNLMLRNLLSSKSKFQTGLIVSERMINMPLETVPPMYKMLKEEMERAQDGHENYEFDYFIVISKVYELVASEADAELLEHKSKKGKKSKNEKSEMDYFHYEDMILEELSSHYGYFDYTHQNQEADSRRVFNDYGFNPKLSLILIDKNNLAKAITEMEVKFPAP